MLTHEMFCQSKTVLMVCKPLYLTVLLGVTGIHMYYMK